MAMVTTLFNGEEPPEYYVDSVRVAANLYSFIFELGLQGIPDTPKSERPSIQRVATIRMSPHHAKVLSRLLVQHLEKYQTDIGPINIPDEHMPQPPPDGE